MDKESKKYALIWIAVLLFIYYCKKTNEKIEEFKIKCIKYCLEDTKLDELKVFPSLTDDYVNVSIDNYFGPITTEVYSLGGTFLDVQHGDKLSFISFNPGVYVCLIFYENNFKSVKVVRL